MTEHPGDHGGPPVVRVHARWIVAWDGAKQRLLERAELVTFGDEVVFVGHDYDGAVDDEVHLPTSLVVPGLITSHAHGGSFAVGRAFADALPREPDGLGFLHYAAPREGTSPPPSTTDADADALLLECLHHGSTTVVEVGGETGVPPSDTVAAAARLGVRVGVGVGFRGADYVTRSDGTVVTRPRPDGGREAFAQAVTYASELVATGDPMVRPLLFPLQADTCDDDLLRDARAASRDLGVPLHLHAAQGWFEYATTLRRHGRSPVRRLDDLGVLGPGTALAHAAFLSGHPQVPFAADDDVDRLAGSGAGVVHCPTVLARRGVAMHSLGRYQAAGIPVAVSTDTFPRDLTAEARLASYLARIVDRDPGAASPWTMLSAVTDVAADLIGAPDLGRLAPGAKADYVAFDLDGVRAGPVVDPVSTWLHTARGQDVVRAVVGGTVRYERAGEGATLHERDLASRQRSGAERTWQTFSSWHPAPTSADGEVRSRLWEPDGPDAAARSARRLARQSAATSTAPDA